MFKKKTPIEGTINPNGLVASPPDARDLLLSAIPLMQNVKRIPEVLPPLFDLTVVNQGDKPDCVGWSCASMKEEKELRERENVQFSGEWIYREAKKSDGMPTLPGTFFREGLKVLQKIGAMPVGKTSLQEAGKYQIGTYAQVDDLSFEGIKKAIAVNGAILMGFRGPNQGWSSAYIRQPMAGEQVWGHATVGIGYNKNFIIGINSWGKNWGDNGLFYVSKDYLPFEGWSVLVDLPSIYRENLGTVGYVAENWTTMVLDKGTILRATARLNFRARMNTMDLPIKTLNAGDKMVYQGERTNVGGYWWLKVSV